MDIKICNPKEFSKKATHVQYVRPGVQSISHFQHHLSQCSETNQQENCEVSYIDSPPTSPPQVYTLIKHNANELQNSKRKFPFIREAKLAIIKTQN